MSVLSTNRILSPPTGSSDKGEKAVLGPVIPVVIGRGSM